MRNDADYHVRSPRGGKFSSLPSSFRTISNYLRSVSANASSIAASTVRQAAVSAASSGSFNHEEDRQREQVLIMLYLVEMGGLRRQLQFGELPRDGIPFISLGFCSRYVAIFRKIFSCSVEGKLRLNNDNLGFFIFGLWH
jgi:hypothetical protein